MPGPSRELHRLQACLAKELKMRYRALGGLSHTYAGRFTHLFAPRPSEVLQALLLEWFAGLCLVLGLLPADLPPFSRTKSANRPAHVGIAGVILLIGLLAFSFLLNLFMPALVLLRFLPWTVIACAFFLGVSVFLITKGRLWLQTSA